MRHALRLARRNLGQTWPNPAVGAVAVKDGIILGTGWTARGGRPHAEPQALAQAGEDARGATLYVTLEPCAHHGKTPPCTEAILQAGIARAVVACRDPFPQVNGSGIARLREAGVEVAEGIAEAEAKALNIGFFSVVARGRPYVAVKLATSQDGCMTHPGERWITGEKARAHGHVLRAEHDAILTGSGTWLTDAPQLTCRLPGLENRSPQRAVLDRRGRVNPQDNLWILREPSLREALYALAKQGITRVLAEGGPTLTAALLAENLADRVYWYRAPSLIGSAMVAMNAVAHWPAPTVMSLGPDRLEIYDNPDY